jgi:hypothetical protein
MGTFFAILKKRIVESYGTGKWLATVQINAFI